MGFAASPSRRFDERQMRRIGAADAPRHQRTVCVLLVAPARRTPRRRDVAVVPCRRPAASSARRAAPRRSSFLAVFLLASAAARGCPPAARRAPPRDLRVDFRVRFLLQTRHRHEGEPGRIHPRQTGQQQNGEAMESSSAGQSFPGPQSPSGRRRRCRRRRAGSSMVIDCMRANARNVLIAERRGHARAFRTYLPHRRACARRGKAASSAGAGGDAAGPSRSAASARPSTDAARIRSGRREADPVGAVNTRARDLASHVMSPRTIYR